MQRIDLGLVGLNFGRHIADRVTKGPAAPYFRLAAVCDMDRARADAVAAAHGVRAVYDLDALLADPAIRVIGLFTGPVGRDALLRRILRAGKDCVTTKPLLLDPRAALEVLREARALGRVIHLNSPGPTPSADLACIAEWRARYALGRPVGAHCDVWASYREKADGTWYDDPRQCPAAPLYRLGVYLVNDLVRLFGEAARVQLLESRLFTGRPTPDNAQLSIAFRSGALASIYASFCVNDGDWYANGMALQFENGTICRNVGPARIPDGAVMQLFMNVDGRRQCVETREVRGASGAYQWEALHRAVQGERLPDETSPEEIAAAVSVLAAMARASATGGTAEVDRLAE